MGIAVRVGVRGWEGGCFVCCLVPGELKRNLGVVCWEGGCGVGGEWGVLSRAWLALGIVRELVVFLHGQKKRSLF